MILVTVGTEQYPFDRLMRWIEVLLQNGLIQEEVIVQYGSSRRIPADVEAHKTLKAEQFAEVITRSRVVISHCGEGSLLQLEALEKPYILVPRSEQFKEHVDDHQVEMAIALGECGAAIAWSAGDLVRFLSQSQVPTLQNSAAIADALCEKLKNRFYPLSSKLSFDSSF